MKWMLLTVALVSLPAASAFAAVVTIRDVKSASAEISADGREIVISATVDLSDGCLSDPRVEAPAAGAHPDAEGVVAVKVLVDDARGPGRACPMMYSANVPAKPVRWANPPQGVKAIKLIGERTPATALVRRPGG